jgi:antitoxin component YwqK of YwqJK toxin-antitoxin module
MRAAFCKKTGKQEGNEPSVHGPYVAFWANGQKQAAGQNKDGFPAGLWTFWDENGVKTGETEYLRGNYHGPRVEFYANGNKKTEEQWRNGKREGLAVAYTEEGKKVAERHYEAGRMVKETMVDGKPVANNN